MTCNRLNEQMQTVLENWLKSSKIVMFTVNMFLDQVKLGVVEILQKIYIS